MYRRNHPFIYFLISINIAVFATWYFASTRETFVFLVKNFLISWNALVNGRYWTLLTSAFSHNQLFHFFINMYVLNSFGHVMVSIMGLKKFIGFYLLAAISGSFFHAFTSMFIVGDPSIPALGASGAIAGIILLFSLTFPKERLLFFGIIPVRAIWGAVLFIGIDIWGLIAQSKGGGLAIGHGAHLGGALIGLLYYLPSRKSY